MGEQKKEGSKSHPGVEVVRREELPPNQPRAPYDKAVRHRRRSERKAEKVRPRGSKRLG